MGSRADNSRSGKEPAMPDSAGWEDPKLDRFKELTKSFLKKFGPLIVTGLAAFIEHRWLDRKDDAEDTNARDKPDDPGEGHVIRKLEREVRDLKKSLSQKVKDGESHGNHSIRELEREVAELKGLLSRQANEIEEGVDDQLSQRIKESTVREFRPAHQERQPREPYIRGRSLEDERRFYDQSSIIRQTETRREQEALDELRHVREYIRPSHRRHSLHDRRRRHRYSSAPDHTSENELSETVRAGKVAAVAGFVEAMNMSNKQGDWIGSKGARVGTTVATSFAASRSRDGDPDDFRGREVVTDVGTGLLASHLIHGSSRRVDEVENLANNGRRRSYCY